MTHFEAVSIILILIEFFVIIFQSEKLQKEKMIDIARSNYQSEIIENMKNSIASLPEHLYDENGKEYHKIIELPHYTIKLYFSDK